MPGGAGDLGQRFRFPLLRMVGLQNGGPHDSMVGCQAEVETHELEDTEVYLGDETAPGSFGWLVPLSDSRALIGIMSRQKLNGRMDRFLSRAREMGKVRDLIITPQRWGIPLRPLSRTYGERVLVVGDAAGLAKPTTGGGIYYALLSGEIAASTANEALLAGDFSARRLKRYEKRWRSALVREMRIGLYARKLYEGLRDGQIERLLGALVTSEVQDEVIHGPDFSFDWHGRAILKAVGHRDVGPLVRSFGPMVMPLLSRLRSVGPFS